MVSQQRGNIMFSIFKPKIRVETITPYGMKATNRVIRGNKIIIRKGKETVDEYAPTFDHTCIINYKAGFPIKRHKQKLLLMSGADQCISFHFSLPEADLPMWDRESEERLFEANVVKASGSTHQKIQLPTTFYVLITMTLALTLLSFLQSIGVVRF